MCRYVRTMAGVIRVFAAHLILQSTLSNTLGREALSGARSCVVDFTIDVMRSRVERIDELQGPQECPQEHYRWR